MKINLISKTMHFNITPFSANMFIVYFTFTISNFQKIAFITFKTSIKSCSKNFSRHNSNAKISISNSIICIQIMYY